MRGLALYHFLLRFCLFLSLELCNDEVCHPRHEAIVMRQYECEIGRDIGLVHTLVWPIIAMAIYCKSSKIKICKHAETRFGLLAMLPQNHGQH